MSGEGSKVIGHLVLRVPVIQVTESESWEIPKLYSYLQTDSAELMEHTVKDTSWYPTMFDEISEGGLNPAHWTDDQIEAAFVDPETPKLKLIEDAIINAFNSRDAFIATPPNVAFDAPELALEIARALGLETVAADERNHEDEDD